MIAFLSPAKSLNFKDNLTIGEVTQPQFLTAALDVHNVLAKKSVKALRELQNISENLSQLNKTRNHEWTVEHSLKNSRQAALAFTGDVYQGMEAEKWSATDMGFAQNHIRILSGLYGMLKPTDLIQPYRLEMGTHLGVKRKKNLYAFWKTTMEEALKAFDEHEVLLNLASQEYFKAIETVKPNNRIIDVEFKDYNKGTFKIISFYAKKARGTMANYLVKNKIKDAERLKEFNEDGYAFYAPASSENHLVFHREEIK